MSAATSCPRQTPWCTDHEPEADQCVSTYVDVTGARCGVSLLQEIPGTEPMIVVDAAVSGSALTLDQAVVLRDALERLRWIALAK